MPLGFEKFSLVNSVGVSVQSHNKSKGLDKDHKVLLSLFSHR